MLRRNIMAIDAGTSALRCHILGEDGRAVASSSRAWPLIAAAEPYALAREWDAPQIRRSLCAAVAECAAASSVKPADIAAVAITSQRQAVAFLDKRGNVIYAGPNLDLRALFEGGEIDEARGAEIYAATGHSPSFLFAPAKLRWFQRNRPADYARVALVLPLADWLAFLLTGDAACERALAGEAGMLNIRSGEWFAPDDGNDNDDSRIAALFAATPLRSPFAIAGKTTPAAARAAGLAPQTPIIVAGPDTQCGILGLGATTPGDTGILAGWSAPIQRITASPTLSPNGATWAGRFLADGKWVAESSAGDAGNAYSWLARTLYADAPDRFARMNAAAAAAPPGADGAMAFLGSGRMQANKPGMRMGGFIFPTPLTLSALDRASLVRAAMESIAFALRANITQLDALTDSAQTAGPLTANPAPSVALGGGMTRSNAFAPLLANALNASVSLPPAHDAPDVSAFGAALCAAVALGDFASPDEAAAYAKARLTPIHPDARAAAEYRALYARWQDAAERLREISV